MTRSANTRRTQQALYVLRREFGGPVMVYRLISSSSDPTTGESTDVIEVYPVDLAVILPAKGSLQEKRGISLISANKQMVQGGQYEADLQGFIIDSRDIPFEPGTDDWLVLKGQRFNFATIDRYEDNSSWLIGARALQGRAPNQVFLCKAESLLSLTQGAADD